MLQLFLPLLFCFKCFPSYLIVGLNFSFTFLFISFKFFLLISNIHFIGHDFSLFVRLFDVVNFAGRFCLKFLGLLRLWLNWMKLIFEVGFEDGFGGVSVMLIFLIVLIDLVNEVLV